MGNIQTILIVGTGLIGSGMATLFLANGYDVLMLATGEAGCAKGRKSIEANFADLVQAGVLPAQYPDKFLARLRFTTDYADASAADFVIEAVTEKEPVKHAVYQALEQHLRKDVVIASVTSAIPPDILAEGLTHKERFLVAHPWNPAHLIPCVEVVRSAYTDDASVETLVTLYESVNRTVVVLRKSIEGFIGNRLQHALYREAIHLVEEGIATPEEIDKVVLSSFGPRFASVGLLEYFDSCNLDLHFDVQSKLFPTLCNDTAPQTLVMEHIQKGELGLKTGKGLFDWDAAREADLRHKKSAPFYGSFVWKAEV